MTSNNYTDEMDVFLIQNHHNLVGQDLMLTFNYKFNLSRTLVEIIGRQKTLGLEMFDHLKQEKENFLMKHFSSSANQKILSNKFNNKFKTSLKSNTIGRMCRNLGLYRLNKMNFFTSSMDQYLKKYYPLVTNKNLVEKFNVQFQSEYSWNAIKKQLHQLGVLTQSYDKLKNQKIKFIVDHSQLNTKCIATKFNEEFKTTYNTRQLCQFATNAGISLRSIQTTFTFTDQMNFFIKANFLKLKRGDLFQKFLGEFNVIVSRRAFNNQLMTLNLRPTLSVRKSYKMFLSDNFQYNYTKLTKLFNINFGTSYTSAQISLKCRTFGLKKVGFEFKDVHLDYLKSLGSIKRRKAHLLFNTKFQSNVSYSWIKAKCIKHDIKSTRTEYFDFQKVHDVFFNGIYQKHIDINPGEVAKLFNKSFKLKLSRTTIRYRLIYLGLHTPSKYFVATKKQLEFIKSNNAMKRESLRKAFNKRFGLSLSFISFRGLCEKHSIYGSRKMWEFQKKSAEIGWNTINNNGYVIIKTAQPNTFELKHRLVWSKHNGILKDGYVITFKDGDKTNCDINNLVAVTVAELQRLIHAKYHYIPDELKETVLLVSRMDQKISELNASK